MSFFLCHLITYEDSLCPRLQIEVLQSPCAEYLAEHITAANIGEICHVVQLTPLIDETFDKTSDRLLPAERRLAQSVFAYIKENADTIACSLSGQLGARLIVNLTVECSGSCISASEGENLPQVDSQLAFAVLLWAHERAVSGERLARTGSEENVQPDDEESDSGGSASGSTAYGPKPKRPGEPSGFFERMHVLSGVSANSANLNKDHNLSSVLIRNEAPNEMHLPEPSKYPLDTPDVRITLDVDELPSVEAWRSGLATFGDSKTCHNGGLKKQAHLLQCPPNAYPESETCLLAPTSLGVKATSIWLGKLVGYLVSLSIKLYRPNSAVSTPSSSRSSVRHQFSERRRADYATRPTGISPSDSVNTFSSSDENQSVRSMGPSFDLNDEDELLLLGGFNGQDTLNSVWVFDSKAWRWRHGLGISIARASFCTIPYPNRPYAVVYGGFNATASLGGFLNSVELILTNEFSSDSTDQFHYCG
ncbi:unnamed protein product [Dicrocoelium dendriticum]|nr:unnamed protein product [Dicrocoelium dendriticum]